MSKYHHSKIRMLRISLTDCKKAKQLLNYTKYKRLGKKSFARHQVTDWLKLSLFPSGPAMCEQTDTTDILSVQGTSCAWLNDFIMKHKGESHLATVGWIRSTKGKLGGLGNNWREFGSGNGLHIQTVVVGLESWHKAWLCPNHRCKHKVRAFLKTN